MQQFDRAFPKFTRLLAPDHKRADDLFGAEQRNEQQSAEAGANDNIERDRRIVSSISGIWIGMRRSMASLIAGLAEANMAISEFGDDRIGKSVGRAQAKLLLGIIEHIDRAGFGTGELCRLGDDGGQDGLEIDRRVYCLGDFAKSPQLLDQLAQTFLALRQRVTKKSAALAISEISSFPEIEIGSCASKNRGAHALAQSSAAARMIERLI